MKIVLATMVATSFSCSPVSAAPTPIHSCDSAVWQTTEVAVRCAQRAGDTAMVAAVQFRREVARAYRADPIGAHSAAKSVRSPAPKRVAVATAFPPQFMKSLKERK